MDKAEQKSGIPFALKILTVILVLVLLAMYLNFVVENHQPKSPSHATLPVTPEPTETLLTDPSIPTHADLEVVTDVPSYVETAKEGVVPSGYVDVGLIYQHLNGETQRGRTDDYEIKGNFNVKAAKLVLEKPLRGTFANEFRVDIMADEGEVKQNSDKRHNTNNLKSDFDINAVKLILEKPGKHMLNGTKSGFRVVPSQVVDLLPVKKEESNSPQLKDSQDEAEFVEPAISGIVLSGYTDISYSYKFGPLMLHQRKANPASPPQELTPTLRFGGSKSDALKLTLPHYAVAEETSTIYEDFLRSMSPPRVFGGSKATYANLFFAEQALRHSGVSAEYAFHETIDGGIAVTNGFTNGSNQSTSSTSMVSDIYEVHILSYWHHEQLLEILRSYEQEFKTFEPLPSEKP
ncbi:MAG: hypothetical protein AAF571_13655 [Verrucomicrobiota bacterium]